MNKLCLLSLLLVAPLALTSCSNIENSKSSGNTNVSTPSWVQDGVIAFSRPMPEANPNSTVNASMGTMLGFLPLPSAHVGTWLSVDRKAKKITLYDGDKEVSLTTAEGLEKLQTGNYQVLHKQRNALWYAPDTYFERRNLKVPPEGDRSRYLRGALGDFVVYLNKDTPLHSGPVFSDDVGGVRLEENDLSRIYYSLPVGAAIEVK